jgi:hypothetical protein
VSQFGNGCTKSIRICAHLLLIAVAIGPFPASARNDPYEPGDWVSWTSMRARNDVNEYAGVVYVATDGGIARYDLIAERWRRPFTMSDGLQERDILAIELDLETNNLAYLAGSGAVYGFDLVSERNNPHFRPRSALRDRLRNDADRRYSNDRNARLSDIYSPEGILSDRSVREYLNVDTQIDRWDEIWLAAAGYVNKGSEWNTVPMRLLPYRLLRDNVHTIAQYGDNFFFGGVGGVSIHNRDLDAWSALYPENAAWITLDDVRDVVVDSVQIWLATDQGLQSLDARHGVWRSYGEHDGLPHADVRSIALTTDDVWIGTSFGVARLDRATNEIHDVSHGNWAQRSINDIAVQDSTVWLATDAGVYTSNDSGTTWVRFGEKHSMLPARIAAIEVVGSKVWLVSRLGVLGYDTVARRFVEYPVESLTSGTADFYCVLSDPPYLWIGSDRGVFRVDTERATYTVRYTVHDGLIDNRVHDMALDENYIWFTTPMGVTRFYWDDPYRSR